MMLANLRISSSLACSLRQSNTEKEGGEAPPHLLPPILATPERKLYSPITFTITRLSRWPSNSA